MRTRLPAAAVVILICACLAVAACGKRGTPEKVPGGNYPTTYPTY